MALVTSPLGTIKQSIDNLNFRTWKDKNVIARRVTTSNQPNTPPQVAQKNKFAAAVAICRALLPALRVGFKSMAKSMTEANIFMSQNLKALGYNEATKQLTGLINLIVSKGSLLGVQGLQWRNANMTDLEINWTDNSNGVSGMATDRLVIAAYDQESGKSYVVTTPATRSQGTFTVAGINDIFGPASPIVCAFFVSADGRNVSDNTNVSVILL